MHHDLCLTPEQLRLTPDILDRQVRLDGITAQERARETSSTKSTG
jgi:hypothetical protein